MASSVPDRTDIVEIYSRYRDIVSSNDHSSSRESLAMLSKMLELRVQTRETIFDDLLKLMSCLDLSVDSHQFNCFYDFVFFICRKNGQKSITVNRAITAWRLVLTGRFRLLNHWCDFVEKYQRHNISEDTWQQIMAFSRCVNEDLEGYDPKGAWPVLIDDFVDHMYRFNQSLSNNCSTREYCRSCDDLETQPSISNTLRGLNLLPGSKRKSLSDTERRKEEAPMSSENSTSTVHFLQSKRFRHISAVNKPGYWETDLDTNVLSSPPDYHVDIHTQNSLGCVNTSACSVEDSLSKGFEGHLSIGCCFQFDQKTRVSFT